MPPRGGKASAEHRARIGAARRALPNPTEKRCTRCGEVKLAGEFRKRVTQAGVERLESKCLPCQREYNAERQRVYWARTPERREHRARLNRKTKLRTQYGMTLEEYDAMLSAQGGGCAICGAAEPGNGHTYHSVDHCHETGRVRGLLCNPCNQGIGMLKDDPELAERAAMYLRGIHLSSMNRKQARAWGYL